MREGERTRSFVSLEEALLLFAFFSLTTRLCFISSLYAVVVSLVTSS